MKAMIVLIAAMLMAAGSIAQESPAAEPVVVTSLEALHPYLVTLTDSNKFSGTVLIAKDGEILFHQAYGLASKRFQVPNRTDTKFNLGSINKIFTEIAILQLVEKGLLSLDDPIGKYLPVFPPEIANKVLVKHLLLMNSGWGDYWDNEYFLAHRNELRTVGDYMEFIKDMPLDYEPGSDVQHSNTGFDVAGAIIEKVTGVDYYEYVRRNIYEPLDMTNTDSYDRDSVVTNLAMGYTNMNPYDPAAEGYEWTNAYVMPPKGTPTGGGYSTAEDLLKFAQGLINLKLLSEPYTNLLWNRLEGNPGDPIDPRLLKGVWQSVGGAPGISAVLGLDLANGYCYVVLSNYDFPAALGVFRSLYKLKP